MLKKLLLYAVGCMAVLSACNKDEEEVTTPSGKDTVDFFVIEDKPGEFNQLAYRIFQETGMPIFVSDTLGEEVYTHDALGNPVTRLERLDFLYTVFGYKGTSASGTGTLYLVQSVDTPKMVKAAKLLRDKVIPYIPASGEYRPKSYFLVDSINDSFMIYNWLTGANNFPLYKSHYVAQKGVCVRIEDVDELTPEEEDLWCGRIIASKVAKWLLTGDYVDLANWYAITLEVEKGQEVPGYKSYYGTAHPIATKDLEKEYGWFGWQDMVSDTYLLAPDQEMDVIEYVARVYAYRGREDEFRAKYADKEKVIRKFNMMMEYVAKFEEVNEMQ